MADLSPNALRMAEKLPALPRGWITAALADAVGVSRRTVLRELPGLEAWLTGQGFRFLRSPGMGLMLDEDEAGRDRLRAMLACSRGNAALSREERRQRLLLRLFSGREPLKSYVLARQLDISENTLSTDLDAVEETLRPWEVRLCRRPGVGVWLEGKPEALRRSLGALVKTRLYARELRELFEGAAPPDTPLAELMDPEDAKTIWRILREFDREEDLRFIEAHMTALAVHLTLTVEQLRRGSANSAPSEPQGDWGPASRLAGQLSEALDVRFTRAELSGISLYLEAYSQNGGTDIREMELRYLASYLIRGVSETMGVDLSGQTSLADDLCSHLRPMLVRLQNRIHHENPQLQSLREEYQSLWEAVRSACDNACRAGLCPRIPDDEAGYLAMHIGAVLEHEALINARLDVAVVCPYGFASGKFLAAQLRRDFPAIHIVSCGSAQDLNPDTLRRQRVDLVVSTVPLKIDFPHIRVNTVLRESDRVLLRAAMEAERERSRGPGAPKPDQRAALRYTAEMSAQILNLVGSVTIRELKKPRNKDIFLREAGRLFCRDEEQASAVEALLWRRENLTSTYIRPLQALLLHCRTDAVEHCCMGYLAASPAMRLEGQPLLGALVLLAPARGEAALEVTQAVSALLIEEPALMEALRRGDEGGAAEILETGLSRRFRDALTMRLL